jgi:hypothetical protein
VIIVYRKLALEAQQTRTFVLVEILGIFGIAIGGPTGGGNGINVTPTDQSSLPKPAHEV